MKTCFKCGIEKPLFEFYRHKQMADGHLNKCKDCTKVDVCANYRANIDHYKDYERNRGMLDHRVLSRIVYSNTDAGKTSHRKARARWARNNPSKRLANIMVGNAVRDGRLIKPIECSVCGNAPSRMHGHHDDYAFPLVVRWLCPGCHTKWHKRNGPGENT